LQGFKSSQVRINERGEVIVSVAVPVQQFHAIRGALMLSTQGADIDSLVTSERLFIFKLFLISCGLMVVLSVLLAGTIAGPVRRLDRLISDISDASRLEAEMQRQEGQPVDLQRLLTTVVGVASERQDDGIAVKLTCAPARPGSYWVMGQDLRLGQVIDNLVDN